VPQSTFGTNIHLLPNLFTKSKSVKPIESRSANKNVSFKKASMRKSIPKYYDFLSRIAHVQVAINDEFNVSNV
jgi:hypothetical protein